MLDTFTKQGYVLDKSRLINGQIFDEDYFEHLIAEIQEIRASERRFYQKITDIYATAEVYEVRKEVYMGTAIIIVVLVIIVIFAVKSGIKHGKGEGGCCGSGGTMKEDKKVLAGDIIATKLVTIEGMHCDNCKNSIEHQINRIDGAACEVNLKKKTAAIQLDKPVDDDLIRRTIERLDFKVVDIKTI